MHHEGAKRERDQKGEARALGSEKKIGSSGHSWLKEVCKLDE
jgi:hypothetical protein